MKKIVMMVGLLGLVVSIKLYAYELEPSVSRVEVIPGSQKFFFYDHTAVAFIMMNLDGSEKIVLSTDSVRCFSVSSDEKKIAYSLRESELWLMNIDGSDREMLTKAKVKEMKWLDSKNLLYVAVDEKSTTINIYNLETKTNKIIFEGVSIKK